MEKKYTLDGDFLREFTDAEYAQFEADLQELSKREEEELAKIAKRQTALAKLEALGLDEDDLKALGL